MLITAENAHKKRGRSSFDRMGERGYSAAMPRTARVAPGGLVFHVLNRSVARLPLFQKAADFAAFDFVRWLTHTHTMRWHSHYHTFGTGHVYRLPRALQGVSSRNRRLFLFGGTLCRAQRIAGGVGGPRRGLALVEPLAARVRRCGFPGIIVIVAATVPAKLGLAGQCLRDRGRGRTQYAALRGATEQSTWRHEVAKTNCQAARY